MISTILQLNIFCHARTWSHQTANQSWLYLQQSSGIIIIIING
jgi:hypothetical protein